MTPDTFITFALFALVTSITPGPNNLMLLASGLNFGVRQSVPHMLGISGGFLLMVVLIGLGLAEVFTQFPWLYEVLKWGGAIYLLYLAWRIATSAPPAAQTEKNVQAAKHVLSTNSEPLRKIDSNPRRAKPMTFLQAAAFQWVNPKAWVMAVTAMSTYVPASSSRLTIVGMATLFVVINLPSVGVWTVFGASLRHFLQNPRYLRVFNFGMAGLLVASLYPLLIGN